MPKTVSQYFVTREYGGPEEGGWWYDHYEHKAVYQTYANEEMAFAVARSLNNKPRDEDREKVTWHMRPGEDNACDSSGRIVYLVDTDKVGEHTTTERPRYE